MDLLTDGSVGKVFEWPCETAEEVERLLDRIMLNSKNTKIPTTRDLALRLAEYVGYDKVRGVW